MEVILDELRKSDVDVDIQTLSQRINYVLAHHEKLYVEMAERLGPDGLLGVFAEMNVNSFGRSMAYLTLVYLMNIPEEGSAGKPKREKAISHAACCVIWKSCFTRFLRKSSAVMGSIKKNLTNCLGT